MAGRKKGDCSGKSVADPPAAVAVGQVITSNLRLAANGRRQVLRPRGRL